MKIAVCIRQSVNGEINPFDACCYEAALRIPNAEITLLSMGPPKTKDFLYNLTRLGAQRAVLLTDNAFAGADTLATAYTLSKAIKKLKPDLVLCGMKTMDGDTAQVGPELSEFIGYTLITNVMKLSADGEGVLAETRAGETVEKPYPVLITVERINNLRLPSIFSKPSSVEVWSAEDINADLSKCGLAGSPTKVIKTFENDTDLRHCKFIEKSELSDVIIASLNAEIIADTETSTTPLKKVWCMGKATLKMGKTVSDDITLVDIIDTDSIVSKIKLEKPNVILWGSDSVSKTTAAKVAARLGLGLCAGCVTLQTDGTDLFMYRPAFSGSIIAKIKSTTIPVMATVRTTEPDQKPFAVGVGMGAKEYIEKARAIAKKYNGDIVATRLMVDRDFLPYEKQVGLTGKSISPKVYLAVGVSGAVHHIAGIRKSGTVIAINNDKNAPIFKYADYGIVCDIKDITL